MFNQANFYELLGIPRDATPDEIRYAYHEAARRLHPDVSVTPGSTEPFLRIQEAYDTLSDLKKRSEYDVRLIAESREPFKIDITYSRSMIPILDESQLVYALLNILPAEQAKSLVNPPLNICLVLDRSTSMQGARMDTVKNAAIELIRQLQAEDIISVVVFSDRAEILLPSGHNPDRKLIESQIRMIRPGGGTEIFQGLETGFLQVNRNSNRSIVNHIILVTDGRTYGDEVECLQLAEKAAQRGIGITGVGIGSEFNDNFMDDLTRRTGGSSIYISRDDDMRGLLQERLENLKEIYADGVALHLDLNSETTLKAAFRLQPDTAILDPVLPIRLGSVPRSSGLAILLEFVISSIPKDTRRYKLASGELGFVLPADPTLLRKIPITLSRLTTDTPNIEAPPKPIFQALSQITLYRMQERARQDVSKGKIQEASACLQHLATQLLAIGERELARTALVEAERIRQTQMISAEGEKEIKYGTRALLLPPRVERVHS